MSRFNDISTLLDKDGYLPEDIAMKPAENAAALELDENGYIPEHVAMGTDPKRTVLGTAKDIGISALKGAIGIGEAVQGLANIPTGGSVGKFTEELGYRPKEAKEILDTYLSPAQKAANKKLQQADGFFETVQAAVENPSTILHAGVESLPLMGAGGVVSRGLVAAAPKVAPWVAGAVGEGAIGAGSAAEQIRQESNNGLMTPGQSAMALASGLGTGAFNLVGGRIAQKLGFADPDTLLVQGLGKAAKEGEEAASKGVIRRIIEGGISEGVFEELPQSVQEQIWQNAALERPLMEGVGNASAMGMLTGAAMGAGANVLPQAKPTSPPPTVDTTPDGKPKGPLSKAADMLIGGAGKPGLFGTAPAMAPPPTDDPRMAEEWGDQATEALAYNQGRNTMLAKPGDVKTRDVLTIPPPAFTVDQGARRRAEDIAAFERDFNRDDDTPENRAAWAGTSPAVRQEIEDRKMQAEWDEQEQAARDNLAGRFLTKKNRPAPTAATAKPDPLAKAKASFDESYNAMGTVPESRGNVTDEEAAAFEKKVERERATQRRQAEIKAWKAREAEADTILKDEAVPEDVKRAAAQQAKEIAKSDPVYQHMAEAKKRGKINLDAMKDGYDSNTISIINRRYPGIFSLVGTVQPDDFASEMGYENLDAMINRFSEARTQKELVGQFIREKMDEWQRAEAEQGEYFQKQAERQDVLGYLGKSYTGKKTGTVFPAPEESVSELESMIRRKPEAFTDDDLDHWTYTADQQARLRTAHREALSALKTSDNNEQAQQNDEVVADDATDGTQQIGPKSGALQVVPQTNEPVGDRVLADTKLFGDRSNTKAIVSHGFEHVDRDIQHVVVSKVASSLHDKKILKAVVESIPVEVMNDFIGEEFSLDMLLDNPSMLSNRLSIPRDKPIPKPVVRFINALSPKVVDVPALDATKKPSLATMLPFSVEGDPTIGANLNRRLDAAPAAEVSSGSRADSVGLPVKKYSTGGTGQGDDGHILISIDNQTDTVNIKPTDAQKQSGSYKKGHFTVHGLDISIENPAGSTRSGTDADGKRWETPMRDHYGYIKGTVGKDKDHIDMFIPEGFEPGENDMVAVVDQVDSKNGKFDEHKVVMGVTDEQSARETYLRNYDQTGKDRIGAITLMPVREFKEWLDSGNTKKPVGKISVSQSVKNETQTDLPLTGETQDSTKSSDQDGDDNVRGRVELLKEWIKRILAQASAEIGKHPKKSQPGIQAKRELDRAKGWNVRVRMAENAAQSGRMDIAKGYLEELEGMLGGADRVQEVIDRFDRNEQERIAEDERIKEQMRKPSDKEETPEQKEFADRMKKLAEGMREALRQENIEKAKTGSVNAAFSWLQSNEPSLSLAEIKDKKGYIDIASDELATWFSEEKKKAEQAEDKDESLIDALGQLVVDGKVTLPEAFFDKAYKAAIAKVKAEAEERAVRRSAQYLEEKVNEKGLSGDTAENFREGWNHAIAGKTRSSLRMNDQITEGYDAARVFLQTDQGKALRKKDQKRKLEGTGAELTRIMDKKRSEINASDNTEAIVKKIMAATNRADLFKGITSDEATPGAQKLLSELRGYFNTFGDFLTTGRGVLRRTYGEYLGRASAEDKMKAYLDLRVHRYDDGAQKTLENETREERVELLKRYAEDYTNTTISFTENIRGDNVKDLAVSLTNALLDSNKYNGRLPSVAASPTWKDADFLLQGVRSLVPDTGSLTRNLVIRVHQETGEVMSAGRTVEILLAKENDDSLKRKSGPPLTPPKLDRVTRKGGKDYRKGRNVTTEEFKQTFGFTDVGFGDYVLSGQDQDHLNYSYDAFMELADLLGLPPKAMSIAGRLYFSIGNLGQGKASAHYNSAHPHPQFGTVPVINVTNTRGDGTVSHEWAHAFDLTTRNMAQAFSRVRGALMNIMNWPAIERDVRMMLKGDMFWRGQSARTATKQERIDNALQLFDYHRRKQTRTQFFKDALDLDGVKTATANPYWSNEKEILARSFEAWVSDKLESLGRTNTYLVNPEWTGDGKVTKEKGFRGTPYPTGEERKLFNRYFDAMVDSLVYEKNGEVTIDMDKFIEKAPNPEAENRAKWEEMAKTFPQLAEEIERDEMAKKREAREKIETTKAMKVGDIIEPRENVEAVSERLKVTFPATIVWAEESDNYYRKVKVLDSIGAEIQVYAYEMRIVTPAEDITTTADISDLPAEATAADSGKLSDADLESIFNDALNEVQESTQEQPDAPAPGTDIASDLKTGDWTREDIQEVRDLVARGKVILVGDKSLGIPTIHDFPQQGTTHHGFGAFTTKTAEYEAHWDGGGEMSKTVGGRAYTIVDVRRGTIPFYDQQAILDRLSLVLRGDIKQGQESGQQEAWRALTGVDLSKSTLRRDVPGRPDLYYITHERADGSFTVKISKHDINDDLVSVYGDGDTVQAAFIRAVESLKDAIKTDVIIAIESGGQAKQQTTSKAQPPSLKNEQDKTVKNLAAEAAKLGVEGIDEALTGLVKLFGGGQSTLMSFPAGFNEETYQQAKPHFSAALKKFQESGKTLKDLFVYLIKNFGAGIKPYALRFAKDEELTRGLGEKTSASKQVATFVADRLTHGQPITWQELFAKADEAWGGTQSENVYTSRDAYDAMEMGVNLWIRNQNSLSTTTSAEKAEQTAERLAKAIGLLPTQTKRTREQIQFQQFSTPPALAYVANWVAKVGPHDVMMEPSAGTGDLAIWSEKAGAKLILNELSSRRAGLLRELFPNASILTEDGLQLNNILPQNVQATVVVMNPPFSSTAGRTNTNDTMNGAKHLEQALKRLAPGGRLVAIVGEGMGASKPSFLKWWKDIKSKYNVRANISINGAEYAKYGTTFDNQIIVIDNTGKTAEDPITVRVDSVAELPKILEAIRNDRQDATALSPSQRPGEEGNQDGQDTLDQGNGNADLGTDALDTGGRGEGGTAPDDGEAGGVSGTVRNPGGGNSGSGSTRSGGSSESGRGSRGGRGNSSGTSGGTEPGGDGGQAPGGTQLGDGTAPGEISVDDVRVEREGELTDSIFEPYKPQRLSIPGAKEHPGSLVQSAAMASVEPPAPTYTPNLPKDVIANGLLSLAQLEAVVYAGQAHSEVLPDGKRRGFFIGDNTGVGKGREISGIILDNIRQGRKRAVWVSKAAGLLHDARRDFSGIGGDPKLIFPKPNSPNAPITQKEGVLFITYDSLKTPAKQKGNSQTRSRLDQVLEWLGEDYDGVVAFDEAHAMGNALPIRGVRGSSKPSQAALSGVSLQDRARNARIVYVSATGATEVKNLSYATRLGLWGENTPFANAVGFINSIVTGGVAAMEMVARDMKALGSYIARSLSFDGIEYRTLRADLSALNVKKYDELARMWQIVLQNLNQALADTGGDKAAGVKKNAMGAFWGAQQRFFNQVLTSMQTPAMIEDAKKQLEAGKSVVVQLTNHYGDQAEREAAKAREEGVDLEEMDLTPRQMLEQFLRNAFPTQEYEEQTDDAGNTIMVAVVDSEGKPVHNADAVAARDRLIETLQQISIPGNPIDTILQELGKDNVAEITGRKKRYLSIRDGKGGYKVVEEKRGNSASQKEAAEFQEGKRRALIFSGAGATGFSFHADRTAKNQQQRIHYVLQPGWRADTAVQGFGRTHRTNQASTPEYVLVTTDVQAQKRFVSSIARRLDQLGALTKGQRETSGGLFNASDNLESKYGHAALVALFTNMANGYTTMDFDEVIHEMGLTNLKGDQGQFLPNNIPEMTKFLNRLLSLTIDRQNEVFGTFFQYLDEIVNHAIEQGTYDSGLQTIKAQSIKKVRDEVVFSDERTGAQSRFVEVDISNPVRFRDFEAARRWAKSRGDKFAGWYKGPRTKIFGLVDLGERLDKDGRPFRRGEVIGIVDGSKRHVDNVTAIRREANGYTQIKDEDDARAAWEKAVEEAPVTSTERKHMLVGVLMPIWDRIVGNPTIFRMQTDSGEVLLGRTLAGKDLQQTMRNLGVGSNLEGMGAQQLLDQIKGGATAILANGWQIKQRMVSGDNRIEITKERGVDFNEAQISILTKQGAFHEVIAWKDRVFIPQGRDAVTVFESITKTTPVVELEGGGETGNQGSSMLSKAATPVPTGNRADIETELRESLGGVRTRRLINSGRVVIVDGQDDMQGIIDGAGNPAVKYSQDGAIQGAYVNGTAYLVRDGIEKGQAFPVLLHELGEHAGQLGFTSDAEYQSILKSLENRKDAKGATGDAIRAAMARVPASTKPEHYWSEVAAYLIENNANEKLSIFDRIKAFFKKLLVKAGLSSPDTLSHKDLVAFARAAVNASSGGNAVQSAMLSVRETFKPVDPNSPNLNRFLGNSQVTTPVYHGSPAEFWTFDKNRTSTNTNQARTGLGFFFATDRTESQGYAGPGGSNRAFYVKIENPRRMNASALPKFRNAEEAQAYAKRQQLSGYDGIILEDEGHVIAFEPNQVKSAEINTGDFDQRNPDVRYSRAQLSDVVGPDRAAAIDAIANGGYSAAAEQDYFKAMAKEGDDTVDVDDVALRTKVADWFKSLVPVVKRKTLGALTLRQLRDVFAGRLPQMEMFYQATREQDVDAKKIMTKADEVYNKWAGLSKKAAKDMSELMIKATIGEVNPDMAQFEPRANSKALRQRIDANLARIAEINEELKGAGNVEKLNEEKVRLERSITRATEKIENEVRRFKAYQELAPMYRTLSKEAKAVYQDVKKLYTDNLESLYAALEERISRQVTDPKLRKETLDAIRLKYDRYIENGPYFPLSRFGEYLSVATKGERREVRTFDSMAERTRYMRRRRREGWEVQAKTKREFTRETAGASSGFVEGIFEILDKTQGIPGQQMEALKDQINQHFIKALPDLSHRKHFVHREKVEGYSRDQMRAFADNMQHAAHHIARIRHADKLETAVQSILQESKMMGKDQEGDEITDLHNELNARLKILNNPEISPVTQALTAAGFVMNIGPSIASALVNMSQTPLVAFPILATRFKQTGAISAMNAMTKATADYMSSKPRLGSGPSLIDNKKLPQHERDMIQALIDDGTIDVTAAHSLAQAAGNDFFNMARTKHGHAAMRAMRLVSYPFHVAELANRKITALAAYRLALKNGFSQTEAIREARESVLEGHFDYTAANRARWMEGNVRRVLLLFKQYSQQMTWLLGRSFYQAAKGETPEVKAMARKRLGMILGGHFLLAGAQGMPVLGGIMATVQFLMAAIGDDDEPKDLEVSLRNMLADNLGKEAGESIMNGPWRSIPGLGDIDLSSRVSLGDLWFRAPEREAEGRDKWNQYVNLLLGPVATNASNIFIGAGTMADGQVWRGMEMMLPKFVKDAMKSVRYANEGVKNWQEDTLLDNLSAMELFGQALGFTPANISEMYEGANAIKNHEARVNKRRQLLVNRWVQATRRGDSSEAMSAMADISSFNQKQPLFTISGDTLQRSYLGRMKAQAQTKNGAYLPATKEGLRDVGRFVNSR